MLGFIWKDLVLIMKNTKSILMGIIIYTIFVMTNQMDASFILPFMMFMVTISTFSYDDYNKWNTYAATLPGGRENIVRGKYLATILMVLGVTVLGLGLSIGTSWISGKIDLEYTFSNCAGYLVAIMFLISVLYPIIFKYGSEKGRMVMFCFSFFIFSIIGIIAKLNLKFSSSFLNLFNKYGIYILVFMTIGFLIISYLISLRILRKKEL